MNNIVVTFTGKAHSGKDLCAEIITEKLMNKGQNTFRLAFADYLKTLCTRNFGYNDNDKENGRKILQLFGTDIVRSKDDKFWIATTYSTIDVLKDFYDFFVISDARFENELQPYPWKMGYPIVNIYVDRKVDDVDAELVKHSSEDMANNPDYDKFHYIIDNNGTIEELYSTCEEIVNDIIKTRDKWIEELLKKE